jgi:hypothetical protein
MNAEEFLKTLEGQAPPPGLPPTLEALWWDKKCDWAHAHSLVDELETPEAMAVHAYLHRKEGATGNAEYWYKRSGKSFYRPALEAEWLALMEALTNK